MPPHFDILRVLVADDSALCRQALRDALESDPEIKVVGEAENGLQAVNLVEQLKPSLVTMDLHMPKLGGLDAIEQIMSRRPTPILVVTDQPRLDGIDMTFAALARGALDLLPKAINWQVGTPETRLLVSRVKLLARAAQSDLADPKKADAPVRLPPRRGSTSNVAVVGLGASTGGPAALKEIFSNLPRSFALPVLLVQHMNEQFHQGFVAWLARNSKIPVRAAVDGDKLEKGVVLVGPQGVDMVMGAKGTVRLRQAPPGSLHSPSVDQLFSSLADTYGPAALGVLLTGMGSDGARGLKAISDRSGLTVAQDRHSSVIHGMPGAAIALGAAQLVMGLGEIGGLLAECTSPMEPVVPVQSTRKKVLMLDDSHVVLEASRQALEEAGYDVITSDNPLTLPALVRRERPDLALVDVKMPAVSGDAVAQIIGQGGNPLKVILYSDLPANELAELVRKCGATGYLRKSSDKILVAAVKGFFAQPPAAIGIRQGGKS